MAKLLSGLKFPSCSVDEPSVMDRRIEQRFDCADNVTLSWLEPDGPRQQEALLLSISRSGVRLDAPHRIPVGAGVEIAYPNGKFLGTVTNCAVRKPNHSIRVRFARGYEWSHRTYWPKGAKGMGAEPKRA